MSNFNTRSPSPSSAEGCAGNHQHEFAALLVGIGLQPRQRVTERTGMLDRLEELGQLARENQGP